MKSIKRALIGLLALAFCFTTSAVSAFTNHVRMETARARDFFSHIGTDTLVIIELEGVLMSTNEDLGSEQWADFLIRRLGRQGFDPVAARAEIAPLWNRILTQSTVDLVDPLVQGALRTLQRNGCYCMGLTLKGPEASHALLGLLNTVDVTFKDSGPRDGAFFVGSNYPARLIDGVLFTGLYNPVGQTLLRFFEQAGSLPGKMVLISSKHEVLQSVGAALHGTGVSYVGIRYSGNDARAASFRPEIAEVQLNFFEEVLSNEAAEILRPHGSFWPF